MLTNEKVPGVVCLWCGGGLVGSGKTPTGRGKVQKQKYLKCLKCGKTQMLMEEVG